MKYIPFIKTSQKKMTDEWRSCNDATSKAVLKYSADAEFYAAVSNIRYRVILIAWVNILEIWNIHLYLRSRFLQSTQ